MQQIEAFLARARRILGKAGASKQQIIDSIGELCDIKLLPKDIEIRKNTVLINAHPAAKSTIYLKKSEIIAHLKDQGVIIGDIR